MPKKSNFAEIAGEVSNEKRLRAVGKAPAPKRDDRENGDDDDNSENDSQD